MTNTKTRRAHSLHKEMLKTKGWSYRSVARELGVNYCHLSQVLNGHRVSASLLGRIEALPAREVAEAQ